jgi:hypothetical protein
VTNTYFGIFNNPPVCSGSPVQRLCAKPSGGLCAVLPLGSFSEPASCKHIDSSYYTVFRQKKQALIFEIHGNQFS